MFRARHLLDNPTQNPVLPDIGFDLLPHLSLCDRLPLFPTYLLLAVMCTRRYQKTRAEPNRIERKVNEFNIFIFSSFVLVCFWFVDSVDLCLYDGFQF